jgi:hypothetical protein
MSWDKHRLQLDPCQGRTDAVVRAVSEREVDVGRAGEVEAVRVGEDALVVVGGAVVEQDDISSRDLPARRHSSTAAGSRDGRGS